MASAPTVPALSNVGLPHTGILKVDDGFRIISQLFSATAADLSIALNPSGGSGGGGAAPTNQPTGSSITVALGADGSMDVGLTWNYTQGTVPADYFVIFWKMGTAALGAPVSSDKAVLLASTATTFTFQGWNPNANYRFGIAAGAKSAIGTAVVVGTIVSPTSGPDWADISATPGNYTANVNAVPATTLTVQASNGQTAYTGTTLYRSAGAPTNLPVPASFIGGTDTDGSARYTVSWNYTQSTNQADGFLFFVVEADTGTFALGNPHFELGARPAAASHTITLKGYPSDRILSFGVAAFRRTELGLEIGTITSSAGGAGPDWQGITTGTPSYAGTIFGVEQHNFTLNVAGRDSTDTSNGIQKDGAELIWVGRDAQFNSSGGAGSRGVYGLSYNLTVYDLTHKSVAYQHCFDLFDFGATGTQNQDVLQPFSTGGGGVTSGIDGKFGNAIRLSATSSPAQTAYLRSVSPHADFAALKSVECWFRRTGNPTATQPIISLAQNSDGSGYVVTPLFLATTGSIVAQAYDGTTLRQQIHTAVVTDGQWHHIAMAVYTAGLTAWVDGVRLATAFTGLTSITVGAPALHVFVGYNSLQGQLFGAASDVDEIILSSINTVHGNDTAFTPSAQEIEDYANNSPFYCWHLQEPWLNPAFFFNARKPNRALYQLINTYSNFQAAGGGRFAFILAGAHEPQANRVNDGLPDMLANIGSSRALFTANSFQQFSAYALVGEPGKGEGNGIEVYAGKTTSDTAAHVQVNFQTQADKIVTTGVSGWQPTKVPGVPTNNPIPQLFGNVASDTGTDLMTIQWGYTQPTLTGTNRPADGFVVYVKNGSNATPWVASDSSHKVSIEARGFAWECPFNRSFSFAVAAYRMTTNGTEVGTPVTSASAPTWIGVGSGNPVTTNGVANTAVTTPKITDNNVTSPKRQAVNVLTAAFNVPPNALNQVTFNHSTGNIPLVTVSTGTSSVTAFPFTITATQIFVSLYNYIQPPSSNATGTVTVYFW